MTHIDMSQSAKTYLCARRKVPFPWGRAIDTTRCRGRLLAIFLGHLKICKGTACRLRFRKSNFKVQGSNIRPCYIVGFFRNTAPFADFHMGKKRKATMKRLGKK